MRLSDTGVYMSSEPRSAGSGVRILIETCFQVLGRNQRKMGPRVGMQAAKRANQCSMQLWSGTCVSRLAAWSRLHGWIGDSGVENGWL